MLVQPIQIDRLAQIDRRLRCASTVTESLISDLVTAACPRLSALEDAGRAGDFRRLIEAGAWTDTALAVVAVELPQWKVRRLAFEDGTWLCSLSKQAYLPLGLDDSVDASHDVLPLAVLVALLEARRQTTPAPERLPAAPQRRSATDGTAARDRNSYGLPCDNFR